MRRGLRRAQHTIDACVCEDLAGKSPVMEHLRQRQAATAAAAAAATAAAAVAVGQAAHSPVVAGGGARAPMRGVSGLSVSGPPPDSQGESDGRTVTDGRMASSADDAQAYGDVGSGTGHRKATRHTAANIVSVMSAVTPPLSLLKRIFDDPAAYATIYDGDTPEQPGHATSDIVACVRKHNFNME